MAAQDESSVGDFTDPDKGRNVVIEKTVGDPQNIKETTRYEVRMAQTSTPISNRKWLSELHDLSKAAEVIDEVKIKALLEGRDVDGEFASPDEVAADRADHGVDERLGHEEYADVRRVEAHGVVNRDLRAPLVHRA